MKMAGVVSMEARIDYWRLKLGVKGATKWTLSVETIDTSTWEVGTFSGRPRVDMPALIKSRHGRFSC